MATALVLAINPVNPQDTVLDRAAEVLREGGLVVAPTETRYGLLARADRQPLLIHLYQVKKRDLNQATAIIVRSLHGIEDLGEVTSEALLLAEQYLPGPLTLVLRSRQNWPPPRVVDGKIGIRWSSSPVILGLMQRLDFPLTATSANISGRPDPECVEEIVSQLGDVVNLYLDAGLLTGLTSTVVDCSVEPVTILRDGAIPRGDVEKTLERRS
jgi:L-threonylcarbamoyladenylate synthase